MKSNFDAWYLIIRFWDFSLDFTEVTYLWGNLWWLKLKLKFMSYFFLITYNNVKVFTVTFDQSYAYIFFIKSIHFL